HSCSSPRFLATGVVGRSIGRLENTSTEASSRCGSIWSIRVSAGLAVSKKSGHIVGMPPRRFVQVIAILLLGVQGLVFLGIVEVCERLRRAFRRRFPGASTPRQGPETSS